MTPRPLFEKQVLIRLTDDQTTQATELGPIAGEALPVLRRLR